jgi:DNA-binding MarR family transcriptional regulator
LNRRENEEYIIGYISLISNKFVQFGDLIMPDITFRQWFLLLMISRMGQQEKTVNSIAEFVGSTRQNVKRMLDSLAKKGYVIIEKSSSDTRALNVRLNQKTYQYFSENDEPLASEMNKLFSAFSEGEIRNLAKALKKLLGAFDAYQKEKENDE